MKRPDGIKLTTVLMAVAVFLNLAAALASPWPARLNESHGLLKFTFTVIAAAIIGIAILLFESAVLWFYWRGLDWSRWIVVTGCLLCFVSLRHFIGGPAASRGHEVIIFYRMAIALITLGYLTTQPARNWFVHLARRKPHVAPDTSRSTIQK